jgi:hypothetical protein
LVRFGHGRTICGCGFRLSAFDLLASYFLADPWSRAIQMLAGWLIFSRLAHELAARIMEIARKHGFPAAIAMLDAFRYGKINQPFDALRYGKIDLPLPGAVA